MSASVTIKRSTITAFTSGVKRGRYSRDITSSPTQAIARISIIILKAKFLPVMNGKSMEVEIYSGNGKIKYNPVLIVFERYRSRSCKRIRPILRIDGEKANK